MLRIEIVGHDKVCSKSKVGIPSLLHVCTPFDVNQHEWQIACELSDLIKNLDVKRIKSTFLKW